MDPHERADFEDYLNRLSEAPLTPPLSASESPPRRCSRDTVDEDEDVGAVEHTSSASKKGGRQKGNPKGNSQGNGLTGSSSTGTGKGILKATPKATAKKAALAKASGGKGGQSAATASKKRSLASGPQDAGKTFSGPYSGENDGWDQSPVRTRTWNPATGQYTEEDLPEEVLGMMGIHEDGQEEMQQQEEFDEHESNYELQEEFDEHESNYELQAPDRARTQDLGWEEERAVGHERTQAVEEEEEAWQTSRPHAGGKNTRQLHPRVGHKPTQAVEEEGEEWQTPRPQADGKSLRRLHPRNQSWTAVKRELLKDAWSPAAASKRQRQQAKQEDEEVEQPQSETDRLFASWRSHGGTLSASQQQAFCDLPEEEQEILLLGAIEAGDKAGKTPCWSTTAKARRIAAAAIGFLTRRLAKTKTSASKTSASKASVPAASGAMKVKSPLKEKYPEENSAENSEDPSMLELNPIDDSLDPFSLVDSNESSAEAPITQTSRLLGAKAGGLVGLCRFGMNCTRFDCLLRHSVSPAVTSKKED